MIVIPFKFLFITHDIIVTSHSSSAQKLRGRSEEPDEENIAICEKCPGTVGRHQVMPCILWELVGSGDDPRESMGVFLHSHGSLPEQWQWLLFLR